MNLKVTKEVYEKICAMRKEGASLKKISEQTGLSHYTICRYTRTANPDFLVSKEPEGSLCWECALSALGDVSPCCWHRKEHKPRDDWKAVRRDRRFLGKTVESYFVIECPGFEAG